MVDAVDQKRETQNVGEEDELLASVLANGDLPKKQAKIPAAEEGRKHDIKASTYMSDITANLAALNEEVEGVHPLVGAEAGLARKVVEMGDQAGHEVRETGIGGLGVDAIRVGSDVVDRKIEEGRGVRVGRHGGDGSQREELTQL